MNARALNAHALDRRDRAPKAELVAPRRLTLAQACAEWNRAHRPHTPATDGCNCGRCGH